MAFAVFDIETRVDKQLLNRVFFANLSLSDEQAYQRFRDELNGGSDFFPLTLQVPISIAVGTVGADYVLAEVHSLAMQDYSEEHLVGEFWAWLGNFAGCLVSFNGRGFDLPVLELAALRAGISTPHFCGNDATRSPASRHFDLWDDLTRQGEVSLRGGLDLLLKMIGLPGKLKLKGAMVQGYYEAGRLKEIHQYCRTDVIQTYFLFLRVALLHGQIDPATYQAALAKSRPFLDQLRDDEEGGG